MDLTQAYDAELVAGLQALPIEALKIWDDLPTARKFGEQMLATMMAGIPDSPHVVKEDRVVPGPRAHRRLPSGSTALSRAQAPCLACFGFMEVGMS